MFCAIVELKIVIGFDAGNLSHNWFDRSTQHSDGIGVALFSCLWTYNGIPRDIRC